jgi:phage major head subunit gpT-like protein
MPNLLIVPPQLQQAALEIVSASRNASGADNVLVGTAEVLVVPELANQSGVWYLADTSHAIKPLIFQLRQAPALASRTSSDDPAVFEQDQYQWGIKARGVAGYGPWWLMARATA